MASVHCLLSHCVRMGSVKVNLEDDTRNSERRMGSNAIEVLCQYFNCLSARQLDVGSNKWNLLRVALRKRMSLRMEGILIYLRQ